MKRGHDSLRRIDHQIMTGVWDYGCGHVCAFMGKDHLILIANFIVIFT